MTRAVLEHLAGPDRADAGEERLAVQRGLGGEVVLDGGSVRLQRDVGEGEQGLVLAREDEAVAEDGVVEALEPHVVHREPHAPGGAAQGQRERAAQAGQRGRPVLGEPVRQSRLVARDVPVRRHRRAIDLERAMLGLPEVDAPGWAPILLVLPAMPDGRAHGLHFLQRAVADDAEDGSHQRLPSNSHM